MPRLKGFTIRSNVTDLITWTRKAALEKALARRAARKAQKANNRATRKANNGTEESRRQAQPATPAPTHEQDTANHIKKESL
jgi:hypothetical protein